MISYLVSSIVIAGLTCVSLVVYLAPLVIGWTRRVPDLGAVAVINILLGWTLIGWVAALALALRTPSPPGPPNGSFVPPPAGGWWARPGGPPAPRPGSPPPLRLPPRPPAGPDDTGHG
jgi:hypothetical protein